MVRSKLCALTFAADQRPAAGPRPSRRGRSLLRQREEQAQSRSLIYKVPVLWMSGASARYSGLNTPVETSTPPRLVRTNCAPLRSPATPGNIRFAPFVFPLKTGPASLGSGFVGWVNYCARLRPSQNRGRFAGLRFWGWGLFAPLRGEKLRRSGGGNYQCCGCQNFTGSG